jgi:NTF2-related export protein 1/2
MRCRATTVIPYPVSCPICEVRRVTDTLLIASKPPSLLVTVSGNVTHGLGVAGNPPSNIKKEINGQPRVFSQTFMLVPDTTTAPAKPGEVGKYYVSSDALRFVG